MFMDYSISLTDNSAAFLRALEEQKETALETIGLQAVSYTKNNLTKAGKRNTGNLINSISHEVRISEDAVYVGSNVEYAPYVEYGTGKFGDKPTGGGWWVYVTGGTKEKSKIKGKRYDYDTAKKIVAMMRAKGLDAHMTQGQKATHFLRDAVQDNRQQYKAIVEKYLKK